MAPSSRQDYLVLLPGPPSTSPSSSSRAALDAAYREPLTYVISKVPSSCKLSIALVAPFVPIDWAHLQSLLAKVYSIAVAVQAASSAPDVDTTVLLVDRAANGQAAAASTSETTVLSIDGLASKSTSLSHVFYDGSDVGRDILSEFTDKATSVGVDKLTALTNVNLGAVKSDRPDETATELHKTVVVAGTFDHLHIGHKLLIQASTILLSVPRDASTPACLIVGITGGSLLTNKKYASEMEPWKTRAQSVIDFISATFAPSSSTSSRRQETIGDDEEIHAWLLDGRVFVRCVNISDVFGPTITEENMDAIVLSAETRKGGEMINEKRAANGWRGLKVYEIGVIQLDGQELPSTSSDFALKISSTEIRRQLAESRAGNQ